MPVNSSRTPPPVTKNPDPYPSKTDWQRLRALRDEDILLTPEHPEADMKHVVRAVVRQGLVPVPSIDGNRLG